MRRREFLKGLAAAAATGSLLRCTRKGQPNAGPPGRPNFVFLFADQLRPDMLGPYGGVDIETPHFDALARDGMTFDHALSTCPLCTPYRGMLMTGRYPTHSGILLNRVDASSRQNPHCLANLFSGAGYDTGYLGKWHLSAGLKAIAEWLGDDEQAIERYARDHPDYEFTPPGPDRLGFRHWEAYNYHIDFRDYWFYRDEPKKIHTGRYETEVLVDQAIAYMRERQAAQQPFLLVVAPHPPHPPFAPDYCPPGYLERILQRPTWRPNVPAASAAELELQVRCYLAMIKNLDDCLGRLVAFMDESGLAPSTLLTVTSDHGEMHGSHGLTGKLYPYAESVDLPLVMRWPGVIPAGVRSPELYTPLDHLPTFCALAGIPTPAEADGVDLSAVLRGEVGPQRDAVLMMNFVAAYSNFKTGGIRPEWRGVHSGRHTYVRWLDGSEALFDNETDPFQMNNLVEHDRAPQVLAQSREKLAALMRKADDAFMPGTEYAEWYTAGRKLIRTALGPVP